MPVFIGEMGYGLRRKRSFKGVLRAISLETCSGQEEVGTKGDVGECARGRDRTSDTRIFSPLLYQLSYPGVTIEDEWVSRRDSNDKSSR
jgi:hypothetical protein